MPLSRGLLIYYTVAPMTTSFFSVLGSSVIMTMIFISKKKFGDPYRRIIFGISFFDFLQSTAILLKVFKTTPEQPNAWIALGNQTSCDILGWMHFAGLNGALLYNVSLNIYLLCLIKYNMTARYYRTRIEPFLHGVPILWAVITSSILVATRSINPAYAGECLIAPYPINCMKSPDVECIRGQNMDLYRTLFRVVPTFASMITILATMGILWWTVRSQEKKMDRYRMSVVSLRTRMRASTNSGAYSGIAQAEDDPDKHTAYRCFINFMVGGFEKIKRKLSHRSDDQEDDDDQLQQGAVGGVGPSPSSSLVSRRSSSLRSSASSSRQHGRPFLVQAAWYAVAFILTHTCPIIVVCTEWGGNKPPVAVVVIAKILVPLQGLFNIFIYTRPHVQKERKRNPRLGYWEAFFLVVRSGGDDDDERTNRFREGPSSSRALALSRASSRNRNIQNSSNTSTSFSDRNRRSTASDSQRSTLFSSGILRSSLGSARSDNSGHISSDAAGNRSPIPGSAAAVSNQHVPDEIVDTDNRRRMSDLSDGVSSSRQSQRSSKRVSILEVFDEGEEMEPPHGVRFDAGTGTEAVPQDREDDHDLDQKDTESGINMRPDLKVDVDEENFGTTCNTSSPPTVFKLDDDTFGGEGLDEIISPDEDIESNSSFPHQSEDDMNIEAMSQQSN